MTTLTYAALLTHAAMSSCLEPSPCEADCACTPCEARRRTQEQSCTSPKQIDLHTYMWSYKDARSVWPTLEESAAAMGVSKPTILGRLRVMSARGMVYQRAKHTARCWGCVERDL